MKSKIYTGAVTSVKLKRYSEKVRQQRLYLHAFNTSETNDETSKGIYRADCLQGKSKEN